MSVHKSKARRMTAALKRHVVPELKTMGYTGNFPRYRRRGPEGLHFLMIAYDKAGTAFFLEFGKHPFGDKVTAWGETVPEDRLLLEHVLFTERARLQASVGGGSLSDDWFHFGSFDDDARFDALAVAVCRALAQVQHWFDTGGAGPNVSRNSGP